MRHNLMESRVTRLLIFRKNQAFRVYILIPLLPAFEGEIGGDSGSALRTILHYNYASICRGN